VIRSFKDKRAESIFRGEFVKGVDGKIQQRAREKLKYLDAAATLGDLAVPPGNQLEALKGRSQRSAQHPYQQAVARVLCVERRRGARRRGSRLPLR
jgi:plasmid maintenance system killer protein